MRSGRRRHRRSCRARMIRIAGESAHGAERRGNSSTAPTVDCSCWQQDLTGVLEVWNEDGWASRSKTEKKTPIARSALSETGARGGIRTRTGVTRLGPQPSASASSATRADLEASGIILVRTRKSSASAAKSLPEKAPDTERRKHQRRTVRCNTRIWPPSKSIT